MNQDQTKIWMSLGVYVLTGATAIAQSASANPNSFDQEQGNPTNVHHPGTQDLANFYLAAGGEGAEAGGERGGTGVIPPPKGTASPAVRASCEEGGEGGEGGTGGFPDQLKCGELLSALRSGGYIIYLTHTQTEGDSVDQVPAKMGFCASQRMLSLSGWQQAKELGQALQMLRIPVEQVFASEYCRAWQTADLAFGRYQPMPALNLISAKTLTTEQRQQMKQALLPLLTKAPAPGTNTVLVGHPEAFQSATDLYPEPQGIAYIIQPKAQETFAIIADLTPSEWGKLMR